LSRKSWSLLRGQPLRKVVVLWKVTIEKDLYKTSNINLKSAKKIELKKNCGDDKKNMKNSFRVVFREISPQKRNIAHYK